MRHGLIGLGLASLGLAVALLLGECAVRVAGLAPELAVLSRGRYRLARNPAIGYEPIPDLAFESCAVGDDAPMDRSERLFENARWRDLWAVNRADYDYRGKANRMGYRDRDHDVAKAPGVYRIVVLGDSIAAGLFIARYENTFPALLEARLRARGLDVEVINLGVNGYNTQQEVETLRERGLRFSPDLVLLAYCANDRWMSGNNVLLRLLEGERAEHGARARWLLRHSHLCRLAWRRLSADEEPALPAAYESLARDTVEAYFAELGGLGREHGFETLVASFPYLRGLERPYPARWERERLAVARMCERYGLHHLDLLPALRTCGHESEEAIAFDGLHPTVTGHRCAAEAMAERITSSLCPHPEAGGDG